MKKQLFAAAMALTMCASSVSVFAEETTEAATEAAQDTAESGMSAEELLQKQAEANKNITSASMDMTMTLDGAMEISDGTSSSSMNMVVSGDLAADVLMKPMQMAMTGDINVSMMGANQAMALEMYMVESEDGTKFDTYQNVNAGTESSGWVRTQVDITEILKQFGVSSLEELQSKSLESTLPEGIDLDWVVEETEDSYLLSSTLKFSDFMTLIEEAMQAQSEEISEEDMMLAETILGSFVMNMSYTIDKESFATKSVHMDFNDSDLSVLNALVSEVMAASMAADDGETASETTVSLSLNDFSIDGTYTYDTVTEINIPADALTAEITDLTDDLSDELYDDLDEADDAAEDAADELEDAVEDAVENDA